MVGAAVARSGSPDLSSARAWPRRASFALILPPSPTHVDRRLVTLRGRDAELELLTSALQEVRSGEGKSILVSGPTGIGKSLLVNEFIRGAHQEGCLCLTASVSPLGAEGADHPALAWLRRGAKVFPDNTEVRHALELFQSQVTDAATIARLCIDDETFNGCLPHKCDCECRHDYKKQAES